MTRAEFATFNDKLMDFLKTETGTEWSTQKFDYDWTLEMRTTLQRGAFVVIQTHAWSWDGSFEPQAILKWLEETPGKMILHLSDPVRPDQREDA